MRRTPRESANIAIAPGRDQSRKTDNPAIQPACKPAMAVSILVDPGPGRAWHIAKSSEKICWSIHAFNKTSTKDLEVHGRTTEGGKAQVEGSKEDGQKTLEEGWFV